MQREEEGKGGKRGGREEGEEGREEGEGGGGGRRRAHPMLRALGERPEGQAQSRPQSQDLPRVIPKTL